MNKPNTLIVRTAGINCDQELAHAFQLAGADTKVVHLNTLIEQPELIDQSQIIGFPGGFSYGDDIAAGRILANKIRHQLLSPLKNAIARQVPIIGICNGFQVLAKLGLLPNLPGQDAKQIVTLADNNTGRFVDKWIPIQTNKNSNCIWTKDLDLMSLPIANGEGRFVTDSPETLKHLQDQNLIALTYPQNPNGSDADIAGITDPTGLILGLMPHPERFTHHTNHPNWTRHQAQGLETPLHGLQFFKNAVNHVLQPATV